METKKSIPENPETSINKEKSVSDQNSESPRSILCLNSSVDSLSLSVAKLSLCNGKIHRDGEASSSSSTTKTHEAVSDSQETGFKNSKPLPIPLYTQSIWTVKSPIPSNGRITMGLNKQLEASCSSSLPSFCGNYINYESDIWGIMNQENQEILNNAILDYGCNIEDYAFLMLAMNSEGSRKLQEIIMSGNPSVTIKLLKRVTAKFSGIPIIYYVMSDLYGCHVCSKLIDCCNEQQLALVVESIVKDEEVFVNVSSNLHGAKVMKKIIKLLKGSRYTSWITDRLRLSFHKLMTNQTGSYVINFCLDCLDVKQSEQLYQEAIAQCLVLATHKIGCVSLNYFIDKIQGPHRQQLLELISNNAVFLSQDPSGNHVVQKVLDLENPLFSAIIGSLLGGHYVKLSLQKWGSHVVEKCLRSLQAMNFAVDDILNCSNNQLLQVARDQYGNYVIQRALKVTKERDNSLHLKLVKSLQPHLNVLRFGYGRNVYNLLVNGLPHFTS